MRHRLTTRARTRRSDSTCIVSDYSASSLALLQALHISLPGPRRSHTYTSLLDSIHPLLMAAEPSHHPAGADVPDTMKLLCSHGERLTPRGRAGGETRVLVVPRDVSFRELTRRLREMTGSGAAAVLAVRHRLADYYEGLEDDDVLVSVACDEELAHMRAEYDRLLRVFVTTAAPAASVVACSGGGGGVVRRGRLAAAGLPPLAPKKMRRVRSEQVPQVHHRAAYPVAPVRRVQNAQEFTGRLHAQQQQSFHRHHHQQCCCCCQRRDLPMYVVPIMSKIATGRVVFTDAAREKARSRDSHAAMEARRTIWAGNVATSRLNPGRRIGRVEAALKSPRAQSDSPRPAQESRPTDGISNRLRVQSDRNNLRSRVNVGAINPCTIQRASPLPHDPLPLSTRPCPLMAEAEAETSSCDGGDGIRLNCSHGGRFLPRGPDGAPRYVGGETRVLVVPRAATFRDLAARLSSEVAGGAEVRAIRHRLADGGLEDVVVSVTCDEELAHMRDEYDRLRATSPAARFRVFVITASSGGGEFQGRRAAASGLPPLAPKMRRVQSAQAQLHRRAALPAPMRRIQSAQEFARATHAQPSFQHRRQQQCCCTPVLSMPARSVEALPCMSKKVVAPSMSAAKATGRVVFTDAAREMARSRAAQAAMENRRAIWELAR
ncbi:hypothetical protein HU200_045302 [Digitaria exilis]|uniref:PB1 domain-containing protein n=1 Tax=Digitaria exilis TaxID=1010633 RepID=A0A835B331_9POAL|nr:hypothetical protein HU200_045302 [Digitaria exilis]